MGKPIPCFFLIVSIFKIKRKGGEITDYNILSKYYKDGKIYYLVECAICGHRKEITKYNYKQEKLLHNGTNCKDDYYDSFIGKRLDDYVVDERSGTQYKIHCIKCGTETTVSLRTLQIAENHSHNHGIYCFKILPDSEIKKAIFVRFNDIKQRCENPNNDNYSHYGGRGIRCEYKFAIDLYFDFYNEIVEHAKIHGIRNSTFDRIDVDGNYCKDNLRISTQSVQSTNTTRKKIFILEKENKRVICDNALEFGRVYGVNGRGIGNVVRGSSKTSGGWKLYKIIKETDNIENVIKEESVTTKLITT